MWKGTFSISQSNHSQLLQRHTEIFYLHTFLLRSQIYIYKWIFHSNSFNSINPQCLLNKQFYHCNHFLSKPTLTIILSKFYLYSCKLSTKFKFFIHLNKKKMFRLCEFLFKRYVFHKLQFTKENLIIPEINDFRWENWRMILQIILNHENRIKLCEKVVLTNSVEDDMFCVNSWDLRKMDKLPLIIHWIVEEWGT